MSFSLRERDNADSAEPAMLSPGIPASAHRAARTGRDPGLPAGLRRGALPPPGLGFSRCVGDSHGDKLPYSCSRCFLRSGPGACGSLSHPRRTHSTWSHAGLLTSSWFTCRSVLTSGWFTRRSVLTSRAWLRPLCPVCSLCGVGVGPRSLG